MTPQNTHVLFAARQHHVISTAQLLALGYTRERIKWLVRSARLFAVHRGVYVVGRPDLTREGRWMAAVLACAGHAALSHLSAAVLHRLLEDERKQPDVIVPATASHEAPRGIRAHRSSDITEGGIEIVEAIRVTKVPRTLIDLSRSRLPVHLLDAAVRQASRIHHIDLQQLRGYKRLDPIVRMYDPLLDLTESEFEARFFALCRQYGLPRPTPQRRTGRRRADFRFEDARVAVECDSRSWHDNDASFLDDRRKDRELLAAGYVVLRFTWAEVVHEPKRVADEIRALLASRGWFGV